MEVGKIQQNIKQRTPVKNAATVHFGAISKAAHSHLLKTTTESKMPSVLRLLKKAEVLKGEVGGILITAIGSGLVAPVFIAFNPLSKKDEDTKKYTALRQPVSAVLSILIQIGLTTPLSKLYDILSNKGKLGKFIELSHERLHSDSYLKKRIEDANKSTPLSDNKLQIELTEAKDKNIAKVAEELRTKGYIEYHSNNKKIDGENIAKYIKGALDRRIKEQDLIIKSVNDNLIKEKSKRAFVLLTKDTSGNKNVVFELSNKLRSVENKDEALSIIDEWKIRYAKNNPDLMGLANEFVRRDLTDLKARAIHTIDKIEIFTTAVENSKLLVQNYDEIIQNLIKYDKASYEQKADILKNLERIAGKRTGQEQVGGLHQYIDKIKSLNNRKVRNDYINDVISRIRNFVAADGDLEEILKVYQNGFYSDKKRFAIESKKILEKLNGAIKDKVDNVIETLTNIRKKLKLKNNQEIAEEVVTQIRENVEKNFKGFKQVTNILVGVFITLPLTCTALNWVYPRFMEVFFPNLANSKKSDAPEEKVGGNK